MATSSGLFLATIYNQSQLAEIKHVARYWSIKTAATAVPLSAHPSPLVITTKLAAAILGGGRSEEVFCRPSTVPCGRSLPVCVEEDCRRDACREIPLCAPSSAFSFHHIHRHHRHRHHCLAVAADDDDAFVTG